jgi:hypothetical protein
MDCERVRNLLSEFLDGSLPEGERTGVNAHLRECLPCRAEKEGLGETLLLLRGLSPGKAPAELLDGVRRRIAREEAPPTPFWKKLFLPAHIKIPLEAAAAILLFLLVYSAHKEEAPKLLPPPPSARMDASPAAEGGKTREAAEPTEKKARKAALPPRSRPLRENVPPDRPVPPLPQSAAQAQSSLPAVPAQLVSTAGERIEPPSAAAPPSRVARPVPFGREVTIEVAAQNRPGLEERIAAAAVRLGGSVQDEPAKAGIDSEGAVDIVRVHLPADSARPFLAELSKLGILPAEGMSDRAVLTAGPSPEVVGYTVRIRVR